MKFLKEHSVFLCILLCCAVLRFLPLFDYQFTYDELSGLERTQFHSFSELIEKGVKVDAHPAFVQVVIYYLTQWFGYTTWILKFPFLMFGFGAICYAYAFGLKNFSKQVGIFSALLFSFSLIFIFYAPIARMYISGVFFSIALLYYFFAIFFRKDLKWRNYFFLGVFAWLSALNQHINALFALTVCLSAFLFFTKENYKAYLVTGAIVILAYLPHLSVTLYQLKVAKIGVDAGGWLEAPEFSVIFSFLKALFGTGRTYGLILLLIGLSFMLRKSATISKKQLFLLLLFISNYLVVYCYSAWRSPIFQYSVMLFSGTAMVLFVCSFLEFKNVYVFYGAVLVLSASLIYKSYFKKDYLNQCVKTVFEYQFERTAYYKALYGDKNVYPLFFDADEIMKKIYFAKYNTHFDCRISADSLISNMNQATYPRSKDPYTQQPVAGNKVSSLRLFSECISHLSCDYVVLSSAMPQYQAIVKDRFPYLLENTQTQGINYKLYSRREEDKARSVADDEVAYQSSPSEKHDFVYSKIPGNENVLPLRVDRLNEFPFDAKAALASVTTKEGQVILVKAKVKIKNAYSPLEACVSLNDAKDNASYMYSAKAASDFVQDGDSVVTIYSEQFNGVHYRQLRYRSNLTCYVWNRARENFMLDDFEIKVINYWSKKWELWD